MSKKGSIIARRGWRLLRLALVWARKGGLFRNRVTISFDILQKVMRKLVNSNESRRALVYGDHEFSFDGTPMVHVKMHRPARFKMPQIPCIKAQVDFEIDEEDEEEGGDVCWCYEYDHKEEMDHEDVTEGIDIKAEKFISNFYEQMKLQSQV